MKNIYAKILLGLGRVDMNKIPHLEMKITIPGQTWSRLEWMGEGLEVDNVEYMWDNILVIFMYYT